MREILFRGKPTERFKDFLILRKEYAQEGFVTGSLVLAAENIAYICVGGFCSSRSIINNGVTTMVEVIPETVGQFIGLLDKNGNKIFEGDILERRWPVGHVERVEMEIRFESSSFGFHIIGTADCCDPIDDCEYGIDTTNFEIIGNIHDNQELLEEI